MRRADVRVALRRANRPVPEQPLDHADVRPALEQVRRERVAQEVGIRPLLDPGRDRRLLEDRAHRVGRDVPPGDGAREQVRLARRLLDAPPDSERLEQPLTQHDVAVAAPLREADVDHHALAVDVGRRQRARLGDAQPAAVGAHEDRAIPGRLDGLEEREHLGAAQDHGERARRLRPRQPVHDLGAPERDRVEEADRRDVHLLDEWAHLPHAHEVQEEAPHLDLAQLLGGPHVVQDEVPRAAEVLLDRRRLVAPKLHIGEHRVLRLTHRESPVAARVMSSGHGIPFSRSASRSCCPRTRASTALRRAVPGAGGCRAAV